MAPVAVEHEAPLIDWYTTRTANDLPFIQRSGALVKHFYGFRQYHWKFAIVADKTPQSGANSAEHVNGHTEVMTSRAHLSSGLGHTS